MIGIVVVSHSRALADAAVGLATEMVDAADLPSIQVAAGLDDGGFGTDATAVAEAIGAADSPDGVVVLLDLGSAVLSAEMALEFVDPALAERVVLSSAPLVEGLVAAVVTAATGAARDAVVEEAAGGLAAKQDHLGPAPVEAPADVPAEAAADQAREFEVTNEHGLHARPAAKLVALVRRFDASVWLTNLTSERAPVDAASLSRVATLNAQRGHRLRVAASGPDASDAVDAVAAFAGRGFDDVPAETAARPPRRSGSGLDVAVGPAVVPDLEVDLTRYEAGTVDVEHARSKAAKTSCLDALGKVRDLTAERVGEDEAAIIDAQLALLDDPQVVESVAARIDGGQGAPAAWGEALGETAAEFDRLDDAYQRARAQDVRAVRRRMLGALLAEVTGRPADADTPASGGILVVAELDAATAATLDADAVAGIVTVGGGATGHGVIVARSRGIPILTDAGVAARDVRTGDVVAFDAAARQFVVDPDVAAFEGLVRERSQAREQAVAAAHEPAVTTDGEHLGVFVNVGSVDDAVSGRELGADGAGLVRTEILFGHGASRPTAAEQEATFREISRALAGRPITIRSWDVGGDKPLPFLAAQPEANPFLGERGVRLSRRHTDSLREQLEAVCRTAVDVPVRVMFPMVATLDEVAWALEQLDEAAAVVGGRPAGLEVGIMVEVPAAALRAGELAAGLDFVSVGTNDLTQYVLAADRGNAAVAHLADHCDPAVLGLIARVCTDVPRHVDVAVCGDLASDPGAAVVLAGLGVRELSATAPAVPAVKAALRRVSLAEARTLAERALAQRSAAEVRALLTAAIPGD